jgi:transcriptional regulator with XRE-family HTH domain
LASTQNFSHRLKKSLPHGSKGKLALFCGVEASTVSRWLSGQSVPGGEALFKIAEFLGVDAKDLMSGGNSQYSANPNESGIGESAHVEREDSPIYSVRKLAAGETPAPRAESLDERVEKMERALSAIAEILHNLTKGT